MNKKKIVWLLIFVVFIIGGIKKHASDQENAKARALIEQKMSAELAEVAKKDLSDSMHGLYQSWVCDFKQKLQPVNETLIKISEHKSIPPDLLPEIKDFNDSTQFMVFDDKLFHPDDGLSDEEVPIDASLKIFAKELNLKTTELEQGLVSPESQYFKNLNMKVELIVAPACALYAKSHPAKLISPSPKSSQIPMGTSKYGGADSEIDKIGKLVSYEAMCKLSNSAIKLMEAIENANTNKAFKDSLLDSSKTTIYDLSYATFSFDGKSLFSPSPTESHWATDFETLKSDLEKSRYAFWASSSNSALKSMEMTAHKVQRVGNLGCTEVKKLNEK